MARHFQIAHDSNSDSFIVEALETIGKNINNLGYINQKKAMVLLV